MADTQAQETTTQEPQAQAQETTTKQRFGTCEVVECVTDDETGDVRLTIVARGNVKALGATSDKGRDNKPKTPRNIVLVSQQLIWDTDKRFRVHVAAYVPEADKTSASRVAETAKVLAQQNTALLQRIAELEAAAALAAERPAPRPSPATQERMQGRQGKQTGERSA